jgi:hypothetical protein
MKTLLLLVCIGLAALAGPEAAREFHSRFIAVDQFGAPLNEVWKCPSCRGWSVRQTQFQAERDCDQCGHTWVPRRLPGFRTPVHEMQMAGAGN